MGFSSSEDHAIYDFEASLDAYENLLIKNLKAAFPKAHIEVDRDARGYFVDGCTDTPAAGDVNGIVADAFGGFDWLVKK